MNGDVEIGPDTGAVSTGDDAARFAEQLLGTGVVPGAGAAAGAAARVGFDRTRAALGRLAPPAPSLLGLLDDVPLPDPGRRSPRAR